MAMYSDSSPVTLRGGPKKLILMGIYLVKNQLTSQFYREVCILGPILFLCFINDLHSVTNLLYEWAEEYL